MPHIFLKVDRSVFLFWCIAILTMVGMDVVAQSQNPFDIKSRRLIDTTAQSPLAVKPDTFLSFQPTDSVKSPESSAIDEMLTAPLVPLNPVSEPRIHDTTDEAENDSLLQNEAADTRPLLEDKNEILDLPRIEDQTYSTWWYYIFDLILLFILLGAFIYDKKIFPPLRKAFVHGNFLRFLYRDTYLRKPGIFLYLNILFLLSFGFILFRIAQYFGQASSIQDYLIIQGVIFILFIVKQIALHFLSILVDKPFEVKFYRYWMILSAGLIGLWMVPVTLMISVLPSQYLFIAILISSIPVVLLLIYRHMKAMVQAKFFLFKHFFHFFLYFCAVEIVPVVLLVDILVKY